MWSTLRRVRPLRFAAAVSAPIEGRQPPGKIAALMKSVWRFSRSKLWSGTTIACIASAAVVRQEAAQGCEERVVLAPVDGFDHLDRDRFVEGASQVAVVAVEHADPVLEAGGPDPFGRELVLRRRDGGGGHEASVAFGRMQREAAPAGPDLEQPIAGGQVERTGQPIELRPGRVGERHPGSVEDRARVRHRLVEQVLEEVVAEVVVRAHVARVAVEVGSPQACHRVEERGRESMQCVATFTDRLQAAEREPQHAREVIRVPPAVGVRLAQTDAAFAQDPLVRRAGREHRYGRRSVRPSGGHVRRSASVRSGRRARARRRARVAAVGHDRTRHSIPPGHAGSPARVGTDDGIRARGARNSATAWR